MDIESTQTSTSPSGLLPNEDFGSRFRAIKILKETSFGSTYQGIDQTTHSPVIIKTLLHEGIPSFYESKLLEEVSYIRKMSHVLPVAPIHISSNQKYLYAILPYVPGTDLRETLVKGSISWEKTVNIAVKLLESLQQAHEMGVVHNDIKPENIILNEDKNGLRVTLIDYGFAWDLCIKTGQSSLLTGTLNYLSPEQAGLIQSSVDYRSDLYSIGILLYECLTGTPPFSATTIGELLRKHLTSTPADIRSFQPSTPRSLSDAIAHLLEKEPKNRYQTARAVRDDLIYIRTHWQNERKDPQFIVGFTDQRSSLSLPTFVGREEELHSLKTLLTEVEEGKGGLAFIEAESGGGKSRLLNEFSLTLDRNAYTVLFGQGVDQAASLPFQLMKGIAQGILSQVETDLELKERIQLNLFEHKETLVSLLPVFRSLFPEATTTPLGPEIFGEQRTLLTLASLIDCIGTEKKPAILIFDDCQWAQDLTIRLFQFWQQNFEDKKKYVLLLLAFRSEEVENTHLLRRLQTIRTLPLHPLKKSEVDRLAQSMSGQLPAMILNLIYQLSQGSPFMASAVLRGLVETGMLYFENGGGWKHRLTSINDVQSSQYAASVLTSRFHVLPKPVLDLLKIGSVLGKEFQISILSEIAGVAVSEVRRLLFQAEERHILWALGENKSAFIHDKLRETLLDLLSSEERAQLHYEVAQKIERLYPENDFEISFHYDAAGKPEKALPYALRSASTARKQYSLEVAETQFRIAERGIRKEDKTSLLKIAESLGDVLMLKGNYEDSASYLTMARTLSDNVELPVTPLERAKIDHKLGELYFKKGDLVSARNALENALKELGYAVPKTLPGFFIGVLHEGFIQLLHTYLPKFLLSKKSAEGKDKELTIIRVHSRLAYTYWFGIGRIPCLWTHLRGMNLAEKYTDTLELAQTYSEHAPVATLIGAFQRGIHYVLKSLEIRKKLSDVWGVGQSLNFYGTVLYANSDFKETIVHCQKAASILGKTGDYWEKNTAEWHVGYAYYRLGDLNKAIEISQRTYQAAQRIGDIHAMGICLSIWSKASGGRLPEEFVKDCLSKMDVTDVHTSAEVLQAEGLRLLAIKNYSLAERKFYEASTLILRSGLLVEYTVPTFAWRVTALRMEIENTKPHEIRKRKKLFKTALHASKKSISVSRRFKNNLPHSLRERALLETLRGKHRTAFKLFNQSIAVSDKQKAQAESARTLYTQARLGKDLKWNLPLDQLSKSAKVLRDLNVNLLLEDEALSSSENKSVTASLLDRFDTILEVGRQIVLSNSKEELLETIYNAFKTLLRAESCTIVQMEKQAKAGQVNILFGDHRNVSRTLLQETNAKGKTLIFLGEQALNPSESIILSQVESAMCVPVFLNGETTMYIYLTHHKVQNLFGEEEQRIASFISTIAGAALEHLTTTESTRKNAEQLLRSNFELERYAYIASHDLQEPLRHLNLVSQMLIRKLSPELDTEVSMYLDDISVAAKRMRDMVTDMLAFSRLESGGTTFEVVSLNELVKIAQANLASLMEEKNIKLVCDKMPNVKGNRLQLISVFQHLIGNSIKFSKGEKSVIEIHNLQLEKQVQVEIRDTGIGFDPKYSEIIFDPFRKLHNSSQYQGSGIGLAACRKVIHQHGGKIWADSKPGLGTSIFFTLPSLE